MSTKDTPKANEFAAEELNAKPILIKSAEEAEEESLILKFKRPYKFEDNTYSEVDLSGLEDITGADMIAVNQKLSRRGSLPVLQEMSLEYAQEIAAVVTGKPVEFFKGLNPKDSMKLKNKISNFIFGED